MVSRGYGRAVVPSHSQLFIDGEPQRLTRYPKEDEFLTIAGVVDADVNEWGEEAGKLEAGFYYDDEEPKTWSASEDIWVHGYWSWDWANSYERVAELDTANYKIVNAAPYGNFAFKKGQRFCFLNILEEVNTPGDYYVDREKGLLYFYPPSQMDENTELLFSVLETPFFDLQDSQGVTIAGVTMECIRGIALAANGVSDLTIDGCHFRNIGNHAIDCKGGLRNRILNCTIHDCGDGGIEITDGDRMTLEPSGSEIINNHIYHIAS